MEERNIDACRDCGAGLPVPCPDIQQGAAGAAGPGLALPSEGLVVVAVGGPVAEHLARVAVGPLLAPAAVVRRVRRLLQRLRLRRAVLGVVQVEAAADVAEETRLLLGQALLLTARAAQVSASGTQGRGPANSAKIGYEPFCTTLQCPHNAPHSSIY